MITNLHGIKHATVEDWPPLIAYLTEDSVQHVAEERICWNRFVVKRPETTKPIVDGEVPIPTVELYELVADYKVDRWKQGLSSTNAPQAGRDLFMAGTYKGVLAVLDKTISGKCSVRLNTEVVYVRGRSCH